MSDQLDTLWEKNRSQISDSFIRLLEHSDLYCPANDYLRWCSLIPKLEDVLLDFDNKKQWGESFQTSLVDYLKQVNRIPPNRERALVLGTIVPIIRGATITLDPYLNEHYQEHENINESLSVSLQTLVLDSCDFPAKAASTMYIAHALMQTLNINYLPETVKKYLRVVTYERSLTGLEPNAQSPSVEDIEHFLDQTYLDNMSEDQLREEMEKQLEDARTNFSNHQDVKVAPSIESHKQLLITEQKIVDEFTGKISQSFDKIECVTYPMQRISKSLEIRKDLTAIIQKNSQSLSSKFGKNIKSEDLIMNLTMKIFSLLIGPIVFFVTVTKLT